MKIAYSQYERYLKADNMIRITAVCKVPDEAEVVVERDVILDNPALTLEVRGWEGRLPPPHPPGSKSPTRHEEVNRKGRFFPLGMYIRAFWIWSHFVYCTCI